MESTLLAALAALAAAATWGSGDFTGGMAARRAGPFHAVLISYSVGLLALVVTALARREALPPSADLIWGAVAGLAGTVGLGFLFRGFATGRIGIVSPVSAVLATAIPVSVSALTEGLPRQLQLVGFGVALAGIWLLSRPVPFGGRPAGLGMALLSGMGFGCFFTALGQVSDASFVWPLVAGRLVSCTLMAAFALTTRRPLVPPGAPLGLLTLAGVLDVGGNLFFLVAIQSGRLDVTSVLASLYPAFTTLLARAIAGEHMARLQAAGVAATVLAIMLITR
jgi:drug/metabolite transporter (DMT)-like permease